MLLAPGADGIRGEAQTFQAAPTGRPPTRRWALYVDPRATQEEEPDVWIELIELVGLAALFEHAKRSARIEFDATVNAPDLVPFITKKMAAEAFEFATWLSRWRVSE